MTGLGWFLGQTTSGKRVISKNGATGGFGSYIAFVPAEHRGVFVVTDFGHLTGGTEVNKLLGVARGNGDRA